MAKENRDGKRQSRNKNRKTRTPKLGYYLIVTDTEGTERCYFNGMYQSIPQGMRDYLVIRTYETKTQSMVKKCKELQGTDAQYRIPWIVFDRDEVTDFDDRILSAQKEGIHVGWSNPCFEIWMYSYFGLMPNVQTSIECCSRFATEYKRKTGRNYSKTDKYLYRNLCKYGNERKACELAKEKMEQCLRDNKSRPSEMYPATKVCELVKEIREKIPYTS